MNLYLRFLAVFLSAMGVGILMAVFLPTVCLVVIFGMLLVCIGGCIWRCRRR